MGGATEIHLGLPHLRPRRCHRPAARPRHRPAGGKAQRRRQGIQRLDPERRALLHGHRHASDRGRPGQALPDAVPQRHRRHHPLHLHRHTFEVTHIAGTPTHGLRKDVVMLGGYQSLDFDFTADQRGLSLFHCHQQLHMDYGFMLLLHCS
ncbi:multicopper oxidase domain-containing protein [Streptomyces sp. NPDC056910]|uniref:multicopper oxidase domain-containing protein n=1 Tax=Streptomyces sp. NPDC056910 TaxID=3345964 RepID=UPI003687EA5B